MVIAVFPPPSENGTVPHHPRHQRHRWRLTVQATLPGLYCPAMGELVAMRSVVDRRRSHAQLWDEVSQRSKSLRSQALRPGSAALCAARSRHLLEEKSWCVQRVRRTRRMRSPVVRPVPEPCGDRLSVLVTLLHATWKPASSRMRPRHLETRINSRSHYM